MNTQNRKFLTVLLSGLALGGALALGYACSSDNPAGPSQVPVNTGGGAGSTGTGGDMNTMDGATDDDGGLPDGGAEAATLSCPPSGSFDNSQLAPYLLPDGGFPF